MLSSEWQLASIDIRGNGKERLLNATCQDIHLSDSIGKGGLMVFCLKLSERVVVLG